MQNLVIEFENIDEMKGKEIVNLMTAKSAESLKTLTLDAYKGNVLGELKNPFPQVISLIFSTNTTEKFNNKNRKLNELFPNLEHFGVDNKHASDLDFIDGHFPKLINFNVILPWLKNEPNEIDEVNIINFLKNNKQIDTLKIGRTNLKLLKAANEILPNLVSLRISTLSDKYSDYEGDAVQFKTVKELIIKSKGDKIPKTIFFGSLVKVVLNVKPELTDKWFKFIEEQIDHQLIIFTLVTEVLSNVQLREVTNKLPVLREARMECKSILTADDVIDFIKREKFLHLLNLDIQMEKSEQKNLVNALTGDWTIEINALISVRNRVKITIQR